MRVVTTAASERKGVDWGSPFFPRLPAPAQMLTESAEAAR